MSNYQFPPLKDETEFENLVNDLCREKYDIEFQVYGRKGQAQSGIDGLSFSKDKKQIVFQCKNKLINRDDKKIQAELLKDLEDEVKSANAKFSNIDTFIFANSFKQDTILQDKAIELINLYGFKVFVWSWKEIEELLEKYPKIAKQYYSYLFDKNILSEDDIKQKLQENSVTLLSSSNLYIENSFIEMPEIDKINDFIDSEDYKDDLLVLTGKAGIGKTAILSKIQSNLIENKIAYLSIKSDRFDIEDKDSFSKFFGVENISHSIKQLARKEKVVVIIDQLDALSLTMSSNKKTINIILEFIEQLKYISNVKVIVSIREYDLKNDPLFKSLDNTNIVHTQLLSFEYVNNKIKSFTKESVKLNNTLIELLRTPLHLSIFIELYPNDNSCISIKSLQDLYNEFWKQKNINKKVLKLLLKIVKKMNKINKIEVSILYFEDKFKNELSILFSKGILKKENKKISFFHQTFYDYVFARDFIQKNNSLYKYILTTNQDLSIREQFKQIIQFLRGTDEDKYLLELKNILYSDDIRFHIKLLLISYLGSLENPTNEEFEFIQELFKYEQNYEKYFIESWISSDWLVYFKDINFFTNENFQKYNLAYKLQSFINKETDLVLELLDSAEFNSELKSESIILSLKELDIWNEDSFEIFKKYQSTIYEDNRIRRYDVEKIYKKVYFFNKEYAVNLFFDFLHNAIEETDNHTEKELLDDDWYEIFEFLLEQNDTNILTKLLNSIQKISQKSINNDSKKEFLITDTIFDSMMWQFGNLYSSWNLYKKTLKKVSELVLEDKEKFLELIKPYQDTRYLSLIRFLIFGYSQNPKVYKNKIFKLFTNIGLLEEMPFDYDDGYEFAMLLNKSFILFNKTEQEQIFHTIIQINPKWENSAFFGKWDNKPVFLGTYKGLQKYKLLCQIDIEDIQNFAYLKEFQELQRKFYWYQLKKPNKPSSTLQRVNAPLTDEAYSKMNLDNWLQSMRVFDEKKSRTRENTDGTLRGDLVEHYRRFEEEVKENPNKFFDLLLKLKSENIHHDYLSAGLNGLIASNYDEGRVLKVIHLYSDIDDKWLKRTILKAIKYLLSKDKFDESLIDILEANKNIRYEGLVRDEDKFQTIDDHISNAIKSFEGEFAKLLPFIFKAVYNNIDNRERILTLINEVIDKDIDFVIFEFLRNIGSIANIDKKLFAKILVDLIEKDKIGQVSIYSLQNFHYLYLNNFVSQEELVIYLRKCISFVEFVKDKEDLNYINNLGTYLFYYYLNESDEIFEELLNEAIASSNQVIHGILLQIFQQEIKSKDKEKVKKSKHYILRFKYTGEDDYSYRYDLTKMNGLNFIQNDFDFIKSLASSIHIKQEMKSFIDYLQNEYYADTSISEKIFEILEELIETIETTNDMGYYDINPLTEFILSLNTRTKSNEKKVKILDLIDSFLISDKLRWRTKSVIE